jgi:hypothetical protein
VLFGRKNGIVLILYAMKYSETTGRCIRSVCPMSVKCGVIVAKAILTCVCFGTKSYIFVVDSCAMGRFWSGVP